MERIKRIYSCIIRTRMERIKRIYCCIIGTRMERIIRICCCIIRTRMERIVRTEYTSKKTKGTKMFSYFRAFRCSHQAYQFCMALANSPLAMLMASGSPLVCRAISVRSSTRGASSASGSKLSFGARYQFW